MGHEYQQELEVACRLAREAGEIILRIYATEFAVASKGKAGPVTEADLQASSWIVAGLRDAFPQDQVVSEEEVPSAVREDRRIWYVDPLDGTREFVAKNGEFAVMIGLSAGGRAKVGVVYRPVTDSLFSGIGDEGSWVEEAGQRRTLHVTGTTRPEQLRLAVSRSHRHELLSALRERIGITQEIQCGSVGLKVGLLALGHADVYLDPARYTQAWDVCGPEAILLGAGGRLTDLAGDPITYGKADFRNRKGLLGTNGVCHSMVLDAIQPILTDAGMI